MTVTAPAVLFGPTLLAAGAAPVYSVPTGITTVLTRVTVTNITASATTLTIWLVRNGGAAVNGNIVVGPAQAISAGPSEPYVVNALAGAVMGSTDYLAMQPGAANALNVVGHGWTNS